MHKEKRAAEGIASIHPMKNHLSRLCSYSWELLWGRRRRFETRALYFVFSSVKSIGLKILETPQPPAQRQQCYIEMKGKSLPCLAEFLQAHWTPEADHLANKAALTSMVRFGCSACCPPGCTHYPRYDRCNRATGGECMPARRTS